MARTARGRAIARRTLARRACRTRTTTQTRPTCRHPAAAATSGRTWGAARTPAGPGRAVFGARAVRGAVQTRGACGV
eukprot:5235890-Prymnesium_polylepis.1